MITLLKLTATIGLCSLMAAGLLQLVSALGLGGGTFILLIMLWVLCPVLFHA